MDACLCFRGYPAQTAQRVYVLQTHKNMPQKAFIPTTLCLKHIKYLFWEDFSSQYPITILHLYTEYAEK